MRILSLQRFIITTAVFDRLIHLYNNLEQKANYVCSRSDNTEMLVQALAQIKEMIPSLRYTREMHQAS
jgi:hypothetical protein